MPYSYRWLYKKDFSEYATRKFETPDNIENNDKQYDEKHQINMINDKHSDERDHVS